MQIGPKLQVKELTGKLRRKLADGRERHAGLPGVTADAKVAVTRDPIQFPYCDRAAYGKNCELAERISDVVEDLKRSDEHGPHFILAWRLYPNKDHPRWQTEHPHSCGCGCGNVAPLRGRKKKRKSKKKSVAKKTTGAAKKTAPRAKKKSKRRSKTR